MATTTHRLMIVDDSNLIRGRIARIVANRQIAELSIVGLASNGEEALRIFASHRPNLVTMDLTMPQMDGIACIEQMARLDPEVRILVVSALADKATAISALKKGAQGFLHKPFSDEQLVSALHELAA